MSNRKIVWLLQIVYSLFILPVKATHLKAYDLRYEVLDCSTQTYRIYITNYRDCKGISIMPPGDSDGVNWRWVAENGCATSLPVMVSPGWIPMLSVVPFSNPPVAVFGADVTPLCPDSRIPSTCTDPNSPVPGTQEYKWYADFSFAGTSCDSFRFESGQCCRTPVLNSYDATNNAMYVSITISKSGCNRAPYFLERPVPYICLGDTAVFNQGAVDPDGDSLVYRIGNCLGENLITFEYGPPPYSINNPIPGNPAFSFDAVTGTFRVAPTQIGQYILCLYVDEYRNGVKIGTVARDMQFAVIRCVDSLFLSPNDSFYPNNIKPLVEPVAGITGFDESGVFRDTVCQGTEVWYKIRAKDLNLNQQVLINYNNGLVGAGFSAPSVYVPVAEAEVRWNAGLPGQYQFSWVVMDDNCPVPRQSQYTVSILVIPPLTVSVNVPNPVCNEADFEVNVSGGLPPYTVEWSGEGGIDANANRRQTNFSHVFNSPGTYEYRVTVRQPNGCKSVSAGSIKIPETAVRIDAGADVTLCSGVVHQLGSPAISGQSYSWQPHPAISNVNEAMPSVVLNHSGNGTVPDTVRFVLNVRNDSCLATDTVVVVVGVLPTATIEGANRVCEGQAIILNAKEDNVRYLWSTGETTKSILYKPSGNTTVSLITISQLGCSSLPAKHAIEVLPKPKGAAIYGDSLVCRGNGVRLTGLGAEVFQWSFGALGNSVIFQPTRDTTIFAIPRSGGCDGDTLYKRIRIFEIPKITVKVVSDSIQCQGSGLFRFEVSGDTLAGLNYRWDFGSGAIPAVSDLKLPPAVRYTTSGVKQISVVVYRDSCRSAPAVTRVGVFPKPDAYFLVPSAQCSLNHSFDFKSETVFNDISGSLHWDFGAAAVPTTDTMAEVKGVRFSAPGEYVVKLSAVNSLGCRDSFIGKVIVYPMPSISSVTGDTVCIGSAPNLKVTGNNVLRYEWYSLPVGGRLLGTGANWRGPAIYDTDTFYVDAVGVGGCRLPNRLGVAGYVKNNQQLNIPLIATELSNFPLPTVAFSVGAGFLAQTYEWDFGDGNFSNLPAPIHSYSNGGNYTIRLRGLDWQGCEYKLIAEQLVQLRDPRLFIFPNAFSPNNDGNNDEWKWIAPPVLSDFTLSVWSRTGNLVYTTTNPADAWDGTYQTTPVSEGVYVWKLTATFPDGQTVLRNGTITVIR